MKIEPDYFLDDMTGIELEAVLEAYSDEYKNGWEQVRIITASFGGEMKLPWDNETPKIKLTKEEEEKTKEEEKRKKEHLISLINNKK